MKKIMKKVLSLVVALVMIVGIIPMTAKAAAELPVGSSANVTYDGTNIAYTYDADKTGTLTITFYTNNYFCNVYEGNDTNGNNVGGSYFGLGDTVTANVEAGKSYYIDIWATATGETLMLYADFEEGSAGGSASGATPDSAIELTSGSTISLNGMEAKYYTLPATNGTEYTLTIQGGRRDSFDVSVFNPRFDDYGFAASGQYGMPATTTVYGMDGCVRIMVQETGRMGINAVVTLQEAGAVGDAVGTEANPDELPVGEQLDNPITLIANERGAYLYYYTWTAEKTGKLSITMIPRVCTNNSYQYSVSGGEWDTLFLDSIDNADTNPGEYYVKQGETVNVWFALPEYSEGSVYFVAEFEECAYPTKEEPKFTSVTDDNYQMATTELELADNNVYVSDEEVTLYQFTAPESAVYEISVDDGYIGQWGTAASLATTGTLTNPNATTNSIQCTLSANETAIVGLTGVDADEYVITVTKVRDSQQDTPGGKTTYENKEKIETYTFNETFDNKNYVDVEDDKVNAAVPGTDGYYHLDSANGKILLVDLDGKYGSIDVLTMANNGALIGEDESGKIWDYSEAYLEYYKAADKETGLYPLTADLIAIYQNVARGQAWNNTNIYGDDAITAEDGWMFNCYTIAATASRPGGNAAGDATGGSTTSTDSPKTGDNANVAVWAIVMVVAAGVAFVVAESKRRAR